MKKFSEIQYSGNRLVLLTAPDISSIGPMFGADFRDMHALKYNPTGSFLGFSRHFGIRLGLKTPILVDGLWLLDEDHHLCGLHKDVQISPNLLSLGLIEKH